MGGCDSDHKEGWTQKNRCFSMWCRRRFLRVPWTARRSNQSILKKINPQYSFERLIVKLQYFGHLMQRADSMEKTLMLGKIRAGGQGDNRGCDGWMASLTRRTGVWVSSVSWWWTGRPGMLWFMGSQRVGHDWATDLNWTEKYTKCNPNSNYLHPDFKNVDGHFKTTRLEEKYERGEVKTWHSFF